MKYVIADKTLASEMGFDHKLHSTNGPRIVLNEKEIMNSPVLKGETLSEKVVQINGTIYTHAGIIHQLKEGGWQNEK